MDSFPCLICGNHDGRAVILNDGESSLISKQLNVVFILNYLLQVPTIKLQSYLEKFGNPNDWISLCDNCTQLTREARSLHVSILKLSSKLRTLQNKIVQQITNHPSVNFKQIDAEVRTNAPKKRIWMETRSFVQKNNYKINQAGAGTDTSDAKTSSLHQQKCPNCFTQIQIQFPQQLTQEDDAPIFHKCLYCTSEFPSITAVLKHFQAVHEMQRLPCLHPNCDATSKNFKNFWKHRQRHLKKEAASKKTSTTKMESEEDEEESPVNFEDFDGNINDLRYNHLDNQEDKISTKEIPEEDQDTHLGNPDPDDLVNFDDDLQDNHSDNDWLPEEEDTEIDINPNVDITSKVTEDPACFTTVIKGGTRTSQQCPQCPLKFPSISSTLRHLSTTHHLKKLPCLHPGCKSALSSIKAYYFHRKIHLFPKKPKEKGPSIKKEKDTDEGPCLCDICGASFKKKQYLNRHKIIVHLKRWKSTQKKVPCHLCGLTFIKGYLKKHILFMHKDEGAGEGMGRFFQCEVIGCKLNFLKREGLDNHMKKKHGGKGAEGESQKQFKCGFCEKEFCFRRKLEQHELSHRNQQLGVRPFVCDICGRGFGVPQNLRNHLNYTHKLAKKFKK